MNILEKNNISNILPITDMQQGMLFSYSLHPETEINFEQIGISIEGNLDIDTFYKSWDYIFFENEAFRTIYRWKNLSKPIQIILKENTIDILFKEVKDVTLNELMQKDRENKFDLEKTPFRIRLFKLNTDSFFMIISFHHILMDGWSLGILINEFISNYTSVHSMKKINSRNKPELNTYFREYNNYDKEKAIEYWINYLKGYLISNPKVNINSYVKERINVVKKTFTTKLTESLISFSKDNKVSQANIFYSIIGIILQKIHGTNDICFDITVSGRNMSIVGIENMIGLFIKTLPIRLINHPSQTLIDIIQQTKKISLESQIHDHINPYFCSEINFNNINQSFTSLVVFENYPLSNLLFKTNSNIKINSFIYEERTNYDLAILIRNSESISIDYSYNEKIFSINDISKLNDQIIKLSELLINKPLSKYETIRLNNFLSFEKLIINKEESINNLMDDECEELNEVEFNLKKIWEKEFGKCVQIDDNFFEIGGNSQLLVKIYKKISDIYPNTLKVNQFYSNSSIRLLSNIILSIDKNIPKVSSNINHIKF